MVLADTLVVTAHRRIRARVIDSGAIEIGFVLSALGLLFLVTPFAIEGDGALRFAALSEFLAHGYVSPMAYSMIGPLASAPLWWLGRSIGTSEWWCARFNFAVFAIGLVCFYRALTPAVDRRTILQFLLLLAIGSMFPHHDSRYYGEVFTAVLVAVGIAFVAMKQQAWGWILAIAGVSNTPAALPGLALASAWLAFRRRRLALVAPVVVALAVVLLESWIRRGSPFITGYEDNQGATTVLPFSGRPGFSYPFAFGLLSILFSFGKGLLWFAPGLVLAVNRRSAVRAADKDLVVAWLLFLTGLVVTYSKWWAWYGGDFWGPRFFLFASIPAAYFIAQWLGSPRGSARVEVAGLACLAWSVWVGINGLVFGFEQPAICSENHYALELLCWYTPEYSALFRPFAAPRSLSGADWAVVLFFSAAGLYLATARALECQAQSKGRAESVVDTTPRT